VLRARFSDARFFWDQDRKKKLDEWAQGLKDVTFHAKLGTIADKVTRINALARVILSEAKDLGKDSLHTLGMTELVERAASLCKADLVTGMVGEFAELQGIMGRYYALAQGEKLEVADAIRDHYKPQGPNDSVPSSPASICVALADKLDTLVSMFAIGEKPTGSKDPFALRRAALGIIRIILENDLRLGLKSFVNDELLAFFHDRLIVQLKDSGIRHDVIKAVVANGDDDLVRIVARARALQDFLASDDGANLLTAYKRAANIVSIEEKKDKATYAAADLKTNALKEKEETELAGALSKQLPHIENLCREEQFVESMKLLAQWRRNVDPFFDKIMVNCDDRELRANRLRLLARIRASMNSIANFAAIEG
jgi:glycyl-tRNA synthetase beta chain